MDPGEGTVVPSPRQAKGRTKLGWKAWPAGWRFVGEAHVRVAME